MQYHLTISEVGSNNPPAHDQDYDSPELAIAALCNLHIQLGDPEVSLEPLTSAPDWAWKIKGLKDDDEQPVDWEANIERWDDDEFSSFADFDNDRVKTYFARWQEVEPTRD